MTFKREAVQNWLGSGKSAEWLPKAARKPPLRIGSSALPRPEGRAAAGAKPGSVADLRQPVSRHRVAQIGARHGRNRVARLIRRRACADVSRRATAFTLR